MKEHFSTGSMIATVNDEDLDILSIRKEFSTTPGPRFKKEGEFSGEEFRDRILSKRFLKAKEEEHKLIVDLDGTAGYGSSFLEEAFGGLARIYTAKSVDAVLQFKSDEETYLIDEIEGYIRSSK